ncbi:MAG TPA: aminotransferase class III-fold pyridoxal phosphate-dependent enzyme [Chitinophagales bacterium]|nr:aminotransferase class III-fold pyridoxal phosphate-dependent enzyme [Chitinophagales bacterium]
MTDLKNIYRQHLVNCINRQFAKSKDHVDKHRSFFSNNRQSAGFSEAMKELTFVPVISRAKEAYVIDADGNKLLDMTMGLSVHLFGHKVSFLEEAMKKQIEKGIALGPISGTAAEVAQLIHEMTGAERCAFYNSGTEAVMVAMRLARAATGKNKVVIFEGAYHGTHDSLLTYKTFSGSSNAAASFPRISQNQLNDTVILEYGNEETLKFISLHSDEIAAVLTEPVQSRHPERADKKFLQSLQNVCSEIGVTLIFDEVITGFRICNGGAAEYFEVKPNITIYGKIAGGGLPIGIVAGERKFLDFIDGGLWQFGDDSVPSSPVTFVAGTFCHHPLTMATAKAVLEKLSDNKNEIQYSLNEKTKSLCEELNNFFDREGFGIRLTYFSSLFRFLLRGREALLFHALLKEKIYIWEGRNCFLSSAHSDEDLQQFISAVKKCCFELSAAGMIRRERHPRGGSAAGHFVQGAIEVHGSLNVPHLELACSYLLHSLHEVFHHGLRIDIVDGNNLEDWEIPPTDEGGEEEFAVRLTHRNESVIIHASAGKNTCDGWSLILFFRELASCYAVFNEGRSLPFINLEPPEKFYSWLNKSEVKVENPNGNFPSSFPAQTIHSLLPLEEDHSASNPNLFEHVLCAFAFSLGEGEHTIGIPVAGQLVSRQLKVFGACTKHVFVTLDNEKEFDENLALVKKQLQQGKLSYRENFLRNHSPAEVVFNFDNLNFNFNFAGHRASVFPLNETKSAHSLVCNVSRMKDELLISLKYATEKFSSNEARQLLEKYVSMVSSLYVSA